MKKILLIGFFRCCLFCLSIFLILVSNGHTKETLRFSTSAQLYDILQDEVMDQFTDKTGIEIKLHVSSSGAAINRLFNGLCDVAGTAERVSHTAVEYGYTEIPLCKAPLVVISHPETSVNDISEAQLQGIFSGQITNWKALGGKDGKIIVIVPGKETAAMKNFSLLALTRFDVKYDIMTYRSNMVVNVVSRIPESISFISKGSNARDAIAKILKVNGYLHMDPAYPYFQNFSLVTKYKPGHAVSAFVEFMTSDWVKTVLIKSGIIPKRP